MLTAYEEAADFFYGDRVLPTSFRPPRRPTIHTAPTSRSIRQAVLAS